MRESPPAKGSSPHTRGAPTAGNPRARGARIIPAYAGSTTPVPSSDVTVGDHPRIRGEHSIQSGFNSAVQGSSPHTRGARHLIVEEPVSLGIIPAYAGSTGVLGRCAEHEGDHPRIRGEHGLTAEPRREPVGSSPHTRGARAHGIGRGCRRGIIPAYAGSTASERSGRQCRWDHPRIRGEHRGRRRTRGRRSGSSPHTRGAQLFTW